MEGQKTNRLLEKLYISIGQGFDISTGASHTCTTNVIRIAALGDSYIKSNVFNEDTNGIFIKSGLIECFKVNIGDIITVISGSINISSVN